MSGGLSTSLKENIACSLNPSDTPVNSPVPYTVTIADVVNRDLILTLVRSGDLADFQTEGFVFSCSFDGQKFATADTLLVFTNPSILSINPPTVAIRGADEKVTITGTGYVDAKFVCIYRCTNEALECSKVDAHGVGVLRQRGERLSDTEVSCDVRQILAAGRAMEYIVEVVPYATREAILPTPTSHASLVVSAPAPSLLKIQKTADYCGNLLVQFDTSVTVKDVEEQSVTFSCSDVFQETASLTVLRDASCRNRGNTIFVSLSDDIETGTLLTLTEGKIRQTRSDPIYALYASGTGSVVDADPYYTPTVQISGPSTVGGTPITLKATIQSYCLTYSLSWTVAIEETEVPEPSVVAQLDALNERLQGLSVRTLTIFKDDLPIRVPFIFTLTASFSNDIDLVASHVVERDDSVPLKVKVELIGQTAADPTVDPTSNTRVSCIPEILDTNIQRKSKQRTWTLAPAPAGGSLSLGKRKRTKIPKNVLEGDTTYTLTCLFSYGSVSATGSITFVTKPRPLNPELNINGKSNNIVFIDASEDLTLEAIPSAGDYTKSLFFWGCTDNALESETFSPCTKEVDGERRLLSVEGLTTVVIPAAERITPRKWGYRMKWTLSEFRGESRYGEITKEVRIQFSTSTVPEIRLPRRIFRVKARRTPLQIKAFCKAKTKAVWSSPLTNGPSDIDISKVADPTDIYRSFDENDDDTKFRKCFLRLRIEDPIFQDGETYKFLLTVDSEGQETSAEIELRMNSPPACKSATIEYDDNALVAGESRVYIITDGCSDAEDGTNIYINYYIEGARSTRQKMNKRAVPLAEPFSFVPEAGTFTIKVEPCDQYRSCGDLVVAGEIIVEDDEADENKAQLYIEKAKDAIVSERDDFLQLVRGARRIVNQLVHGGTLGETVMNLLKTLLLEVIEDTLSDVLVEVDESSDPEDKLEVLEDAAEVFTDKNAVIQPETETKKRYQTISLEVSREKTGKGPSAGNRRKRATSESTDDYSGILPSEAVIILAFFDEEGSTDILELLENVMIGMCQASVSSAPDTLETSLVSVRTEDTNTAGRADTAVPVSCTECPAFSNYTATVKYGSHIETAYGGEEWDCGEGYMCSSVCVSSAQITEDLVTVTADTETIAPPRRSDIVITKMINPNTWIPQDHSELTSPILVTFPIEGSVDLNAYSLECLMWISDDWRNTTCASTMVLDEATSAYSVTCSCTALGILGVFEKAVPETDTTTTSTTTTTTTTTTTLAPSKPLPLNTKYIAAEIILSADYNTNVPSKDAFIATVKRDLQQQLDISIDIMKKMEVRKGSIIITFELHPPASGGGSTLGQIVYQLEAMVADGSLVLHNANGDVLSIASLQLDNVKTDDDDKAAKGESNTIIIVGAVVGGVVLIAIVVVGIVLWKKIDKSKTFPAPETRDDGLHSVPVYTPPPPYQQELYPQVSKWMENELRNKDVEVHKPGTPSTLDASLLELRLLSSRNSREPTTVSTQHREPTTVST